MAENDGYLDSIENNNLDRTYGSLNMTDSSPGGGDKAAGADVPGQAAIVEKIEADSRSVYVGNVDYRPSYGATVEELKRNFDGCGSINRATILSNQTDGSPKRYAFIEFVDKASVQKAMEMDGSLFRGRKIKVTPKRTNKPGISSTERPPGSCGRGCPFRGGASPRRGCEAQETYRAPKINPNELPSETVTSARFRPNLGIVHAMKEICRALKINPNALHRESATSARFKPNLDIVHAMTEIFRALDVNPNALPRETVTTARLKPNLDIVHAKKEIYRALNINPNAPSRETVKCARFERRTSKRTLDIVHAKKEIYRALNINTNAHRETVKCAPKNMQPHGAQPPGPPLASENCSRLQDRNRTAMHLDSESCKDGCVGKHTSDSGRQTSSSSSNWKRLQLGHLKEEVKQLVLDRPDGVWCTKLMELYREQYDRELDYLCFGYTSIVSFACSLQPRVLVSEPTESGDCLLHDARRIPARLRPAGADAPVEPDDTLPGLDFTSECYLNPRFHALETGATPNYAEIHAFLRDGIALDYVDDYRQHMPAEAYRPPPTPASDPSPSPSPTPPPLLSPLLEIVSRVPLFPSQLVSSQDSDSESDSYDIVTEEPCSSSKFMAQPYPPMQSLYYPMYTPHGTPAPQFYQMPPATPGLHHPTPVPPLRRPYLSSTEPVEFPASETKTPPRPRSPPSLDNLNPPPQFDQMPPAPPGQHHSTPVPALRRPYLSPAKPVEFPASQTKTPPLPGFPPSLDNLDPPPQFDQMPPAPPSQHHRTPMPALRRPYLSLTKPVESPASETKTPPRPRSPPSLDNLNPPPQFDQMPPSQHHPTPMPALRCPYLSLTNSVESPASESETPPRPRSPPPLYNIDPPPQFYQMVPAPPSQYHTLPATPGQHHPCPGPPLRCPYLSPTKSVEFSANETKTSPRPRSPPPPYNDVSGGGGADVGGTGGGGETRRVNKAHGDVTLTASECKIFSLISGVDPKAAHWYMVDAISRRMTTSTTTVTSAVASTLNPHSAEFRQVAATQTEASAGTDSLQSTVNLLMESLQATPEPPPGFK